MAPVVQGPSCQLHFCTDRQFFSASGCNYCGKIPASRSLWGLYNACSVLSVLLCIWLQPLHQDSSFLKFVGPIQRLQCPISSALVMTGHGLPSVMLRAVIVFLP
jgi:hypothetical protein